MATLTIPAAGERAGRREWLGLAVLALPTLLLSIDMSVLYLALPHLSADLHPSTTQTLWIMDIYGFMVAGFLVTMGTLGDRIGRRRLLLIGAGVFSVVSVVAAYSSSPAMLIGARALLGIAGATLMPSTLALISTMFRDPAQRGLAIAVWISCFMGGTILGPVVGGLLLESFWWGSAFLLGVPVMLVLLIAGPLLLPEQRDPSAGWPDLVSVVLSLGSILPVIYAIKTFAKDGWGTVPAATLVFGIAMGLVFLRRQRTAAAPILDVKLFSNRSFSTALIVSVLGCIAMAGTFFLVSQYAQLVLDLTPLRAGLLLVPSSVAMLVASLFAPRLGRKYGAGRVVGGGMLISAVGFVLLTQIGSHSPGLLVAAVVVVCGGLGPMPALLTDLVVGSVPPEKAGSASAVSETGNELGIASGVAVIGSLASAVYRHSLGDSVPGASGLSRESLAGALTTADSVGGSAGTTLANAARTAFTTGLHTAAIIAMVIFVGLAAVALRFLAGRPAADTSTADTSADTATADGEAVGEAAAAAPQAVAHQTVAQQTVDPVDAAEPADRPSGAMVSAAITGTDPRAADTEADSLPELART
jgi:MFS transporter, DHA2 family, multidrug resistance protein